GMLPNSNSIVWFTNAGYKALALGPSTRAFPDSLTIHDLTVSSPTGSVNTLLLNFLGVLTPLKAGVVWVETNSTVLSLNSRMELSSGMVVQGSVRFGQFSELVTPHLEVGHVGAGEFHMTNGMLNVGDQFL